ncbi:hypothetical protein MTY59_49760 [Mycobacterium senriense]|uniref:Uncharacterized protein n=1 Tax=Mycobacterium senriense TaxID=2775496 RepID=A0ABN6IRT8_9MYCO|nr:hypothetical protein MTY59_49760 [Mycobacterium senriense]
MTVSPPVSPNVVAKTLMTQNPRVTAGTLVNACFETSVMHSTFRRRVPIRESGFHGVTGSTHRDHKADAFAQVAQYRGGWRF